MRSIQSPTHDSANGSASDDAPRDEPPGGPRPMPARCWVDLFDGPAFRGERRRIFGPTRLDAHLLGLDRAGPVSVRVGGDAALRIELAGGADTTLHAGEALDALRTDRIRWLEVRAELH